MSYSIFSIAGISAGMIILILAIIFQFIFYKKE